MEETENTQQEPVTLEAYREQRGSFWGEMVLRGLLVSLGVIVMPGLTILAIFPGDMVGFGAMLLWTIIIAVVWACMAVFGPFAKKWAQDFVTGFRLLRQMKKRYIQSLPLAVQRRRMIRIISCSVAAVVIPLAVTAGVVTRTLTDRAREEARVRDTYDRAQTLVIEEQYAQARVLLETIGDKDYLDTQALLALCKAHGLYDDGYVESACSALYHATFQHQTQEQMDKITAFHDMIRELQFQQWHEEEERRKAYIREHGVPYVGMYEGDLSETSLGPPSDEVGHGTVFRKGKKYSTNIYYYYRGDAVIFKVVCADSFVISVDDRRDDPYVPVDNSSYWHSDDYDEYDGDMFDVDSFYDPEDFYEEYQDDFYDYEEAEEYFYAHGG